MLHRYIATAAFLGSCVIGVSGCGGSDGPSAGAPAATGSPAASGAGAKSPPPPRPTASSSKVKSAPTDVYD